MDEVLTIEPDSPDGRFARFELISWWDQQRLHNAKILVIGAGALGNEILKNLALLGVGNVIVADLDKVENSNLSRSVLFRVEDCGLPKAEVAARAATAIYPDMNVKAFHGNVVYDLGLGVFRWADVIIGGLDNREARVAINQAAARTEKIWIDGAIERLDGVARVFDPSSGPCYECTMNAIDWKMLEARRSCALLRREEMEAGKVPTTPTTASVVAGIQCQEAVKYLHNLPTMAGQGFVFDGLNHQSYTVAYTQKEDCLVHEIYEPIVRVPYKAGAITAADFLAHVRTDLGRDAVIEFNQDLLSALYCPKCDQEEELYDSLGKVSERRGRCAACGEQRVAKTYHVISGTESFLTKTLGELGVPEWDILSGRNGTEQRFYELAGDAPDFLGALAR